jgi:hypothetical protein
MLADWLPYSAESLWFVRSGYGAKIVFGQFRNSCGWMESSALVPSKDESHRAVSPPINRAARSHRLAPKIWIDDFEELNGQWVSYDYQVTSDANIFFPASWSPKGGVEDSAHIWVDSSRWAIDALEKPHSILALLTYTEWAHPMWSTYDLGGATIEFYLRGESLNLLGASVYFWLLDKNGRWHKTSSPLRVGEGTWLKNSVYIDPNASEQNGWHNSWNYSEKVRLDPTNIRSFGISFTGFPQGEPATGKIALDKFHISQPSKY